MGVGDVFSSASEGFARWTPLLWGPVGEASAAAAKIGPGDVVLDACCGNGSSAIPAARAAGAHGHVDGLDLSTRLLARARGNAAEAGIESAVFHESDVMAWHHGPYDAVLCVFGVFFLPDMDAGGRHLLSRLRPGGRLVVTTWETGSIETLVRPAAEAVIAETGAAPSGTMSQAAAGIIGAADLLDRWLTSIGATDVGVERFVLDIPLTPDLAWDMILGSGARMMLDGLDDAALLRIRADYERRLGTDVFPVRALIGSGTHP